MGRGFKLNILCTLVDICVGLGLNLLDYRLEPTLEWQIL